jgi:hypothetical protein
MVFLLNDQNVFQYLIDQRIVELSNRISQPIESKICKNFNLLIHFSNDRHLLVKQEPHDRAGKTNQDFLDEWRIYQLLCINPELEQIRTLFPEVLHFDSKHSILVFNYLKNYCDLDEFYNQKRIFPSSIAAFVGVNLARIHRATYDRPDYKDFLTQTARSENVGDKLAETVPDFSDELEKITPEIFGQISTDGLKFYELYQRYASLGQAIAQLNADYKPICLIHNDLKLGNILLHHEWESWQSPLDRVGLNGDAETATGKEAFIRFIDWEKWLWGDPASDLGTLVASYLKIWLKSLVVRAGIDLETALRLATTPLEAIQPSIAVLMQSYLSQFPEVLERFPDFLQRVMQFTGLALIESIQTKLHYHEPFGNTEICMLQVAKTLLCTPVQSIPTVCGVTASALLNLQNPLTFKVSQGKLSPPSNQSAPQDNQAARTDRSPIAFTPEEMLHDLVHHIQIRSDFSIHHPHYTPSTPPIELGDRLSLLPANLQQNYLRAQLQNYLYEIYFSGEESIRTEENGSRLPDFPLENNTIRGLNVQFYEQLRHSNSGKGYFDPGWQVLRRGKDGRFAVQKDALTLWIHPKRHLPAEARSPVVEDSVSIRLPNHQVEAEFYVAVGDAGLVPDEADAIELYFNVTAAGAIELMQHVTQQFNAIGIPFSFKVLADPVEYGRYDSAILQVGCIYYEQVWQVLQPIYQRLAPHAFHSTIPLFTKAIAPGIGLAEEPDDDRVGDFGMSRLRLVADALLSVWKTPMDTPEGRMNAIQQYFHQQELSWQQPYLNSDSQDIYFPFDDANGAIERLEESLTLGKTV